MDIFQSTHTQHYNHIIIYEIKYLFSEFKKQIVFKLNKVLYKLDTMQNKINLLEQKISHPININEELDIQLPILSQEELQLFEEQLGEEIFKNKVVLLNIYIL